MDNERRRILRMMAEGKISVEECEELLQALSDRRKDKTEKEVQAVQGERPIWPYVMLVILALLVLPVSFVSFRMVPCVSGPIAVALFIFWVWMIVDCLSRLPCDFRLLFTTQHQHEKWIWLAIVILAAPVGAIVYFFIIRQPARQITPPSSTPKTSSPAERPLRPSRPARSIKALVVITILLAISIPTLIIIFLNFSNYTMSFPDELDALLIIPAVVIVLMWLIFWIWMIIDCLARDYREFGTLITSDKSADKVLWLLLILFTFIIGGLAYHISIRRRPRNASQAL